MVKGCAQYFVIALVDRFLKTIMYVYGCMLVLISVVVDCVGVCGIFLCNGRC